ncbi:hypothetical protein KKG72_07620 [bacterium]|nr:hypothetical protein [bacterium]MBU1994115.1 hypothetical protein [bacterium]
MKILQIDNFIFDSATHIIKNGDRVFHFKGYNFQANEFTLSNEISTSKEFELSLSAFISSKEKQKIFLDWLERNYPECYL